MLSVLLVSCLFLAFIIFNISIPSETIVKYDVLLHMEYTAKMFSL